MDDDDVNVEENEESLVTVRVSTKYGTKRWEIKKVTLIMSFKFILNLTFYPINKKNDTFQVILDELAKIEKANAENLLLVLSDKPVNFYDTPLSINLKITDILGIILELV